MKYPDGRLKCVVCLLLLLAFSGFATANDPLKKVADLIGKLEKANGRLQAVQDLADLGPQAAPAVPDLIKLLHAKDEDLRINIVLALGRIGTKAVLPLAQAVASKDDDVRFHAVWALGMIGKDAQNAAPAVTKALADPVVSVRRKAGFTLGRLGVNSDAIVTPLVKALDDTDGDVREAAADALTKIGEPAVLGLIGVIRDGPVRPRNHALMVVGAIGSDAKAAIPALRSLLLGKDSDATELVVNALVGIGKDAIPALVDGIKDERPQIQRSSFAALARLKSAAGPTLAEALSDKRPAVRALATQTLGTMMLDDKSVVVALGTALEDPDLMVKSHALNALHRLKAKARPAAAYLQKTLTDSHPDVRAGAFDALRNIGDDFRPALLKALASKDVSVRIELAGQIIETGVEVDEAMPILLAAMKEKDAGVRLRATQWLQRTHPSKKVHDKTVVLALGAALQDDDARVTHTAADTLQRLGKDASPATPRLQMAITGSDSGTRRCAFLALKALEVDFQPFMRQALASKDSAIRIDIAELMVATATQIDEAVPVLLAALQEKDPNLRVQAAKALGNRAKEKVIPVLIEGLQGGLAGHGSEAYAGLVALGQDASAAAPALIKLFDAPDYSHRQLAAAALSKIGGDSDIVVPAIVKLLEKENNPDVRLEAVRALSLHGDRAIPVLVELIQVNDRGRDKSISVQAISSLLNLQGDLKGSLPLLAPIMRGKDTDARKAAVQMLARLGKQGLPLLVDALKDEYGDIGAYAGHGIRSMGLDPSKPSPALLELALKDPYVGSRHFAVQALAGQGADGIKLLMDALRKEKDADFRSQTVRALLTAGPAGQTLLFSALQTNTAKLRPVILTSMKQDGYRAKAAVNALIVCLKDGSTDVRAMSADVLGAIGPDASAAVVPLTGLLDDTSPTVRTRAREALKRIRPSGK